LVAIWLVGSSDTLHLTLEGKYFSEARTVRMSADSSSQLLLIPNTIQGMPSGWSTTLYLKNDSTLTLLEFGYFIGDPNHDGKEEVNVPEKGGWMKLNTSTGDWVAAQL
ncbi:MAG: hypothetical protein Q8896_13565, partial [Bacteroidota bacterium]|nr:hypothetical protein [Bacteroidota bacterium]